MLCFLCYVILLLNTTGYEMNVDHRSIIRDNITFLKDNLIVSTPSTLLSNLLQLEVLNEIEVEDISCKQTRHNQVDRLLYFIRRTSLEQYQRFLESLVKSNQEFICDRLRGVFALQ